MFAIFKILVPYPFAIFKILVPYPKKTIVWTIFFKREWQLSLLQRSNMFIATL